VDYEDEFGRLPLNSLLRVTRTAPHLSAIENLPATWVSANADKPSFGKPISNSTAGFDGLMPR
jgi:hypothetical protein